MKKARLAWVPSKIDGMITLEALSLGDSSIMVGMVYRITPEPPHSLSTWGWLNNLTGDGGSCVNATVAKDALAESVKGMEWGCPE